MSFSALFLQAATAGAGNAAGGASLGAGAATFVPFIFIILIMYFLMIRPQNKKQKELQRMLDALKKGDKVVTIGGIHGTVTNVKDDIVTLRVDDNTKIDFNRSAIASVVNPKSETESTKTEKKGLFSKGKEESKPVVIDSDSANEEKKE